MTDAAETVRAHYARSDLLGRIFAFLADAGVDAAAPAPEDLYVLDQLHGRGLAATEEHAERAGLRPDLHALDLGCGVGGAARYLAHVRGCRVTGIDLTAEFVAAAEELTRRCGLADRVAYRTADALDLPFAEASFDHVFSHNVTMNIPDKAGLAREVARVLKPGGRFTCVEVALGPKPGAIDFPVPWASGPAASFVVTPEEMRAAVTAAGLGIVSEVDLTPTTLAHQRESRARADRGEPPLQVNSVVMGDDMAERARNSAAAVADGRLVDHFLLAEKG